MNAIVIIQGRLRALDLPNKIILPIYKSLNILEILSAKLSKKFLTVLAVPHSDVAIISQCMRGNVLIYGGDEENIHSRYKSILEMVRSNYKYMVRICADSPFVNSDYIDGSLHYFDDFDFHYLNNCKSPVGCRFEIIDIEKFLETPPVTNDDIQGVTNAIKRRDDICKKETESVYNFPDGFSIPLNNAENYFRIQKVFNHCGKVDVTESDLHGMLTSGVLV